MVEFLGDQNHSLWARPAEGVSLDGEPWTLKAATTDDSEEYELSKFKISPTDRYTFKGELVTADSIKPGLGASVTVEGENKPLRGDSKLSSDDRIYYGMTAVLRFEDRIAELSYYDPLERETVSMGGRDYDLAGDFSSPLFVALSSTDVARRQLMGFFNADKVPDSGRLRQLQPYSADKIPVLVIHGLGDSPATWVPVVENLRGYRAIRENYQFWFFSYPSGLPYPIATATLREQLRQARSLYPGHKDMVVIGHSMGGMIARLLMTDSGTTLWDAFFTVPPEQLPLDPITREKVRRTLIFEAEDDIARVLFASASHRGSETANDLIGRIGARLVGNPFSDRQTSKEIEMQIRPEARANCKGRLPNSVELLDPEGTFLQALNPMPVDPSIPFHSLIGDQGKGGNLSKIEPVSTDGVVPYWSSHMDGAVSEKIIPSKHWTHLHEDGLAEITRVLMLHIGQFP